MDNLCGFLVSVFLFNFVYSATLSSDGQASAKMCGFPPVAEHTLLVNSCSVDNLQGPLSVSLKTICDRFAAESDCYFPEQANFPIVDFMSDIKDGTLAADNQETKPIRLGRNCQYIVERQLMTDDECHDICGSDRFLVCDVFVAMENTLKKYFVQEVRVNGSGYQNLDSFVHSGKYKFLFPYPIQESYHVSSTKLEECLKPKENVASNTVTVCSMLGEVAVEFARTGKNFSMDPLDYFRNVSSTWDPCENLSYFAKSSLPGVQVLKDQEVCKKTCNESNSNICRTVVLGLQYLAEKSSKGSEDGDITNSEKKLDTNVDKTDNMEPDKTAVTSIAQALSEEEKTNFEQTDIKSDDDKKTEILETPEVDPVLTNANAHVDDKDMTNDIKDDKAMTGTSKEDDHPDLGNEVSETGATNEDFNTSKNPDDAKNSGTDHEETHEKEGTDLTNTDESGNENGAVGEPNSPSSNKETIPEEITNENNESPDGTNSEKLDQNGDNVDNKNEDKDTSDTEKDPLQVETPKEEAGNTVTEPSVNKDIEETEKQSKVPEATTTYSSSSTSLSTSLFSGEIDDNDIGFTKEDIPNKPSQASDEKYQPKETVDDTSVNKQETVSGDSYEDDEAEGGHFMAYFLVFIVVCVAGYIVFHNKQKIIALVIEGKGTGTGRRPATKEYRRLKTEDVMPSLEKSAYSKNYVF